MLARKEFLVCIGKPKAILIITAFLPQFVRAGHGPVAVQIVILMTLLTWGLIRRFQRPHADGAVIWLLLIGYGAYRLAITPFRTEVLTSMEWFSAAFIASGILGLLWTKRTTPTIQAS